MNIIPELMINELDLEEVDTICSLNSYYKKYCYDNGIIQEKLKEAKENAKNSILLLNNNTLFSCLDYRQVSYYQSLFDYLNIQTDINQFYKDYYIHDFKIADYTGYVYSIILNGKRYKHSLNIFPINRFVIPIKSFELLLTYLYYNQIL